MLLNGDCAKTLLQTATVKTTRSFVGDVSGNVVIHAGDINGFYFKTGLQFLIVAKRMVDGTFTVTSCGGTKPLNKANADLAYLRSWPKLPKVGTIFGQALIGQDNSHSMVQRVSPLRGTVVSIQGPKHLDTATNVSGKYKVGELVPGTYQVELDTPLTTRPSKTQTVEVVERGCAVADFWVVMPPSKKAAGGHS